MLINYYIIEAEIWWIQLKYKIMLTKDGYF